MSPVPSPPSPRISVVMGVYNRERYVAEAIDSVLAQSRSADEIIVVDDASTDGSLRILEGYGDRIRLIRREVNSGMCQITRNQAARAATGELIAFLDSDDAWKPEKLERQVAFMQSHSDIPLCHTYAEVIDAESRPRRIRHDGNLPPTGPCFSVLARHCFITISSVMVRRSLFDDVGWFDEDPFFRIGEDWEFFLRVARTHPVGVVDAVLTCYRESDAGITAAAWEYRPKVVPLHQWLLDHPERWKGSVARSDVVAALADACYENAVYWRGQRHPARARRFATQGLRCAPWRVELWKEWIRA